MKGINSEYGVYGALLTKPNMCIALISTAHPDYALILIDNRDVYN